MDQITNKKLLIVKQLYSTATHQHLSRGLVNRMLAVIGFDLTAETALKLAMQEVKSTANIETNFPSLIQQIKSLYYDNKGEDLPFRKEILRVHSLRNDAQHKARYPNEMEVLESRVSVKNFLESLLPEFWGVEFDDLSMVQMIEQKKIREYLKDAEGLNKAGNYLEAIRKAKLSISWVLHRVRELYLEYKYTPFSTLENAIDFECFYFMKDEDDKLNDITKELEFMRLIIVKILKDIHNNLVLNSMDINNIDYLRYERLAGPVHFGEDITDHTEFEVMEDVSEEASRDYVNFCIDTVLQIETIIGNIDDPNIISNL